MKRPRGTGSIFQLKGRSTWWVKFYRNGRAIRESSGSAKIRDAEKLLARRLAEVSQGTFIEPRDRKITVDQLYSALLDDYRNNGLASLEGTEQRWRKRLEKHFGGWRALNVTTEVLNRYVNWCREKKLSSATVNRDLAALRRAFRLGLRAGKIQRVPAFPHLKEAAPRSGFVEEAQFRKLADHAKELWFRGLITTAYTFGFRKSELLNLRVAQVSLVDRTIRLNAGETKSGEGRLIKLTQDVFVLLQALVAGKSGNDHVFTRSDGREIRDFREAWAALCAIAELPGLLFHDLRRSAVRNMVRRGIPERVAMQISGHKTRTVFERYNIVSETDLAEAAQKIEFGQHSGNIEPETVPEISLPPNGTTVN
jgi:integrase